MKDLELCWTQTFSPLGYKFEMVCPNYNEMEQNDSIIATLYWLELEMYNGGFIQFFCNWGYDAYLLSVKGLEIINAITTKQLLVQGYNIIQKFEDDDRLKELNDIYKYLTKSDNEELSKINQEYCESKENIMQLMLLKFHPDLIRNIDNK